MLHRCLHHPVLVDAAVALELGRPDDCPEVVATTLIEHLNLGTRKRIANQPLDLSDLSHPQIMPNVRTGGV